MPRWRGCGVLDRSGGGPEAAPQRERVFNIPAPVLWTIVVLVVVHLVRLALPERSDADVLANFAFVPGRLTLAWDPQVERFFPGDGTAQPWTILTYALLHADWAHLGLNALWLLAFGAPVARRLGAAPFLSFLAVASMAGAGAHYAVHFADLKPVIGASAAVSGCMGASLRFMVEPRVPLSAMMVLAGQGGRRGLVPPLLSLARVFQDRRALAFIGVWFGTNLLFGLGAVRLGGANAAIAWEAHVGGFLAGLLLLPSFDRGTSREPAAASAEGSGSPPGA